MFFPSAIGGDFEHCIRALAYRCENRAIPPTMGASIISGLINWEKIRKHKKLTELTVEELAQVSGGHDPSAHEPDFSAGARLK